MPRALRLALVLLLLASPLAHAQLFRAYLAPTGSDSNPCTLAAPCRLLPAALAAVASGGEIWMLDSANYNTATVTIGKSVSILAVPGALGSVVAIGGPAVSITSIPSLKVALRNLVIVPLAAGDGTHGVSMTGPSTLFIENSLIANLPGDAVHVLGAGNVKVTDTIIRNNAGYAVSLMNGASADVSGTQMLENGDGGVVAYSATATTTKANVSDSIISGGQVGAYAVTTIAGAVARTFVSRSTIESTSTALGSISVAGSALVTVSGSTITNNNKAWDQSGGVMESSGNNHIRGNAASTGTLTLVGLQ